MNYCMFYKDVYGKYTRMNIPEIRVFEKVDLAEGFYAMLGWGFNWRP